MDTTQDVRLRRSEDPRIEEHSWGRLLWMVSQELGNSEEMTVGQCRILPGQSNPRHQHPNCDEVLHVLSGRIRHSLDDEEFEMGVGDTVSIARHVWHNATNIGDDEAVLMIAFSGAVREVVGE